MTLEQQRNEFWVRERKICIQLQSAQASFLDGNHCLDIGARDETRDKASTSHYEDVDGIMTLKSSEKNRESKIELERLQDECRAYQEQSKEQKEQVGEISASAHLCVLLICATQNALH